MSRQVILYYPLDGLSRVGYHSTINGYSFNDWFDHAEINVSDDEDARAFCERFAEFVTA